MPSDLYAPADNEADVEVELHEDSYDNGDSQLIQQQRHAVQPAVHVRTSTRSNKGKPPERLIETANQVAYMKLLSRKASKML